MAELEIMHIDMDAFFAAVEQLYNPKLKGKPVIVGGISKRGVVSTSSYEARKYGVHSAMPMAKARKLCPHATFISGNHDRYKKVSERIFNIFYQYTPKIEKLSIDEAFLDLSGCHGLYGDTPQIGCKIRQHILNEIGIDASVGIASNKFLAKLASGMDKPNGFKIIHNHEIAEVLNPLPISKLWGVGEKTEEKLNQMGIHTIKELKKINRKTLIDHFGKQGNNLYNLSRGIDSRSVNTKEEVKSISQEITFNNNLIDNKEIYAALMKMSDKVGRRLRKKNLGGNTVFVKVRYPNFSTLTRRKTTENLINTTEEIYETGKYLLIDKKLLTKPIRLLGIGVSSLSPYQKRQLSLFNNNKNDKLNKTIDKIRKKYGIDSVKHGIELYKEK